jgi:hypothetical protein
VSLATRAPGTGGIARGAALLGALVIAVLLAAVPRSGAAVITTTSNANNAFAAKTSFANPLSFASIGPAAAATNSKVVTVDYPVGSQVNDLLLLVEVNSANQNIATPSGWTLLADTAAQSPNQFRFTVWWRLKGAGDSSVDLDIRTNSSGATARVIRYVRTAGYPPNPVSATAAVAAGSSGATATRTPTPDITTNQADATVISLVAIRAANTLTLSAAQSFTLRSATTQTTGQATALGVADRTTSTSPSTPTSPTWSQSGTAAQWAWATVAFA